VSAAFAQRGGTAMLLIQNAQVTAGALLSAVVIASTPTTTVTSSVTQTSSARPCAGDCRRDGVVTVRDVLTMEVIALGSAPIATCEAGDANDDGQITIDELLAAITDALNGCWPTPTPHAAADSPMQ
jgi:hypothetical protein